LAGDVASGVSTDTNRPSSAARAPTRLNVPVLRWNRPSPMQTREHADIHRRMIPPIPYSAYFFLSEGF